jgi:hypothetical protein
VYCRRPCRGGAAWFFSHSLEDDRTEWFENDVIANKIRLHYYRTGESNKPSVLIVPGVTDMSEWFNSVVSLPREELTTKWRM